MKKKLVTGITLFFCVFISFNDATAQYSFSYGLKGGLNLATFNDVDNVDSKKGFLAGAFVNLNILERPLSIQPEVIYTQKGVKASGDGFSSTIDLDYIEVPVLAKFEFPETGPVTPGVFFGPYLGFNINAEGELTGEGGSASGNIDESIKDTDFGFVVGGGLDISFVQMEIRYAAGLSKVFEDNSSGKNSVFSIVAGINF